VETAGYNRYNAIGDASFTNPNTSVILNLTQISNAYIMSYGAAVWSNTLKQVWVWGYYFYSLFPNTKVYIDPTLVPTEPNTQFFGSIDEDRMYMLNSTALYATGASLFVLQHSF